MEDKVIRGYKGFDKDLKCRGFQYEVGKEYECKKAVICKKGFHFCENPLDVFNYYFPSKSRYCEVEGSGEFDRDKAGNKVCCTKIKIIREITLEELIGKSDCSSANCILSASDEDSSVAANGSNFSTSVNAGKHSLACNEGYKSSSAAVGAFSKSVNVGLNSVAISTGDCSSAVNSGKGSLALGTGDFSHSAAMGQNSIAFVTGFYGKAKGDLGCWLVLTESGGWDGNSYSYKDVKVFQVDGKNIKPDTFYQLIDGKPVEVK